MYPPDCKLRSKRSDPAASFEAAATPKMNREANGAAAELPKSGISVVTLSPLSFIVLLLGCAAASFSGGYLSRTLILTKMETTWTRATTSLNLPGIPADKKVPRTKYTFQQFVISSDIRSNSVLLDGRCSNEGTCDQTTSETNVEGAESNDQLQGIHEPSGQHVLVDIENVDATFLNSEYQLATAIIALVNVSSITLLSYHCIGLKPMGVSCVGVLLKGHLSFHTWPLEGVITFDLYSCGPNSLLPLLPAVKELFGVPRDPLVQSRMVWGHKQRGFLTTVQHTVQDEDVRWITDSMNVAKENVATVKTQFQWIDIYDLMEPRFDGRDRVVFLDGIIQSRGYGENAYHEALVHPALFAHDNPRRVLIIGGGEGATLREVLKHSTVQEVFMIEIDKGMVDVSKQYLSKWSDCGNLIGSTDSCFDDPRAKVYYKDAIAWFLERFGPNATVTDDDLFDVIIMDALDPNSVAEFSDLLYGNDKLTDAFARALGDEGIFIAQVGEAEEIDDPPERLYPNDNFLSFVDGLQRVGFESIVDYDEGHGRLAAIGSFVLAMKNSESRANWFMGEAEMNLKIQKRSLRTKNGESPFLYFDGATMMQYQFSSRIVEETWCRDKPDECKYNVGGIGAEEIFDDNNNKVYQSYRERHFPFWLCGAFVALRDVEAGEELLDSYLVFGGDGDPYREHNLQELKMLCYGGTGRITEYEEAENYEHR